MVFKRVFLPFPSHDAIVNDGNFSQFNLLFVCCLFLFNIFTFLGPLTHSHSEICFWRQLKPPSPFAHSHSSIYILDRYFSLQPNNVFPIGSCIYIPTHFISVCRGRGNSQPDNDHGNFTRS
jgi:hypothetical protein